MFRRLWRWLTWDKDIASCTNCGTTTKYWIGCSMIDRCVASQNGIILEKSPIEEMRRRFDAKQRVTTDTSRPLCLSCANKNNFICYQCELESLEEKKK